MRLKQLKNVPITQKNYTHPDQPKLSKEHLEKFLFYKPQLRNPRYLINPLKKIEAFNFVKTQEENRKKIKKSRTMNLTVLFHCYLREYPKMIHWARF